MKSIFWSLYHKRFIYSNMQGGERYNSISDELKRQFGSKTIKLGIDAGFTCPNRDGRCGYGGCAFCSGDGSGELASHLFEGSSASQMLDRGTAIPMGAQKIRSRI